MYTEIPITTLPKEDEKTNRQCYKCGKITNGHFEYGGVRLCKMCWFIKIIGPLRVRRR